MLRHKPKNRASWKALWAVAKTLPKVKDAISYWAAVDQNVIKTTGTEAATWEQAKTEALRKLPEQAEEQIRHLENEKEEIKHLSKEILVTRLIKTLRIDAKIAVIKRCVRG